MFQVHVSDVAASLVTSRITGLGSREVTLATPETAALVADNWGLCLAEGLMSEFEISDAIASAIQAGYPVREAWLVQHRAFARAAQIGAPQALFH